MLIKNKVPRLLSFIPSLFFLYIVIPSYTSNLIIIIESLTIVLFIVTVKSVLNTVKDYFKLSSSLKRRWKILVKFFLYFYYCIRISKTSYLKISSASKVPSVSISTVSLSKLVLCSTLALSTWYVTLLIGE